MRTALSTRFLPALGFVFAISCGDSALPRARGAASIHWDTATTGTKTPLCRPGAHWANAPVAADDAPQLSDTSAPAMAVDGDGDNSVRCRVAPQGDKYAVSARILSRGTGPSGEPLSTDISLGVLIGAREANAQGTLYAADHKTLDAPYSSDTAVIPPKAGCLFSVVPSEKGKLGVKPGSVWATVTCAHVGDQRNQASEECAIGQGFFAFEDCVPQ